LFLLVVGLFFVVWQRNKVGESSTRAAPVSGAKPAVAVPTNSATDPDLVSVGQTIHK